MKYNLLILISLISFSKIQSQSFEGIFEEGFERLIFHHDTVYYLIGTNGGLIYPIIGYGTYYFIDSFLVIENQDSSGVFNKLELTATEPHSFKTYLIDASRGCTVFRIDQMSNCSVKCFLLSYDFEFKKNIKKSLRKLYRKHWKIPYFRGRERIYKKAEC